MKKLKDFLKFLGTLRPPKVIKKVFLSVFILLVLFIVAGVAYTFFVGSNEPEVAQEAVSEENPIKEIEIKSYEPAPDANVGVAVQALTTPVKPGNNATASVKTLPGALCDISVEYNEVESNDTGLIEKEADKYGNVSWTWTVEDFRPEGEWPVQIDCRRNKKSGMLVLDLEVVS